MLARAHVSRGPSLSCKSSREASMSQRTDSTPQLASGRICGRSRPAPPLLVGRSSILVGRSCRGAPAEPRDGRSGGALGGTAERSRRDERVCRRSRRGVFASPTTPSFSTRSVIGASAWCVLPANDKNRYLRGQSGFRRPQGIPPEGTTTSQTGGGALNICTLGLSLVWGPKWGTLQRASVGSAGTSQND